MKLIRVRRPGYLQDIQEEMNRMIEDTFERFGLTDEESEKGEITWRPAVELNQQNGNYQVKAELPGVKKEDIDIEVGEDTVTIKAETKKEEEEKKENVYRSEIRYGKFKRILELPSNIDSSRVSAEFKDGILTITLPRTEEEKEKTRKVEIG